jgi:uncharacterized coiled-coil DUF342 family protein
MAYEIGRMLEGLKNENPILYEALREIASGSVDDTAVGLKALHDKLIEERKESHALRQELIAASEKLEKIRTAADQLHQDWRKRGYAICADELNSHLISRHLPEATETETAERKSFV